MGWITDRISDADHEGYVSCVFADGATGAGSSSRGVLVTELPDGHGGVTRLAYEDHQDRPAEQITGWVTRCACGWTGQRVTRARQAADHDPGRWVLYACDEDAMDFDYFPEAEDVTGAMEADWRLHIAPLVAASEIAEAHHAVRLAHETLDEVVTRARAGGVTWEVIGRATGMTRQSAQQRWGTR